MLLQDIKKANMDALKSKNTNARAIYSVLLNKCMLLAINKGEDRDGVKDEDVVSLIQKTLKELEDESSNFVKVGNTSKVELLKEQSKYLEVFLPKMLSEEEIKSEIEKLDDKTIPNVMRHFKTNFAGKCDMGKVSQIARQYQG